MKLVCVRALYLLVCEFSLLEHPPPASPPPAPASVFYLALHSFPHSLDKHLCSIYYGLYRILSNWVIYMYPRKLF